MYIAVMHGEENSSIVEGEVSEDGRRFKVKQSKKMFVTFFEVILTLDPLLSQDVSTCSLTLHLHL